MVRAPSLAAELTLTTHQEPAPADSDAGFTGYQPAPQSVYRDLPPNGTPMPAPQQVWRDPALPYRREAVLRLLRGESVGTVSRDMGVPIEVLQEWLSNALDGIDERLGETPTPRVHSQPGIVPPFRRMG